MSGLMRVEWTVISANPASSVHAIRPAVYDVMGDKPADLLAAVTARSAKLNAERAQTEDPILSAAFASGSLGTAAGIYEIATGKVSFF